MASLISRIPKSLTANVRVESAGINAISNLPPTVEAQLAARLKGYDLDIFRSSALTEMAVRKAGLILCMEKNQVMFVKDRFPFAGDIVWLLGDYMKGKGNEIDDPYGSDINQYIETLELIDAELDRITRSLWATVRKNLKI